MHFKKSQITIFIILGLIIFFIIVLFYMLFKNIETQEIENKVSTSANDPADFNSVENFIKHCVEEVPIEGLIKLGMQGGYIDIPEVINYDDKSFWYVDQINIQPSLNQTLVRLKDYVEENLVICSDFDRLSNLYNMDIKYEKPNVTIFFSRDKVYFDINYSITVSRDEYVNKLDSFSTSYDLKYREIFEMASLLLNNQLKPEFNISNPLKDIASSNFYITQERPRSDILVYTIIPRVQLEDGRNYVFNFASKFGRSDLARSVKLHDNSRTSGVVFPYVIFSIDRMAQLFILSETRMELDGKDVEDITVRQFYPEEVVREDITIHLTVYGEDKDSERVTQDKIWETKYPIYQFEPTGLKFNNPQRLVLYWDDELLPRKGEMGIIYNNGSGWVPIPSAANYDSNFLYTDIEGFSEYTLIDCGELEKDKLTVKGVIDPGSGCFVRLIVIAAVIAVVTIMTAGAGGVLVGSSTSTSAFSFATTFSAMSTTVKVAILAGSLVGGAAINAAIGFGEDDNSINFVSTCKQDLTITEKLDGSEGKCHPDKGTYNAKAGEVIVLASKIKKCTGFSSYICGSCSLECSTEFI